MGKFWAGFWDGVKWVSIAAAALGCTFAVAYGTWVFWNGIFGWVK